MRNEAHGTARSAITAAVCKTSYGCLSGNSLLPPEHPRPQHKSAQRADVGWPLLHALGKFSCVFLPMAVAGSRNNLTRRLQQSEFHWLCQHDYMSVTRSRSAFATTLTEESAMAAAAMIGESSKPKFG